MFGFLKRNQSSAKGYKISNVGRTKKYGIVVSSLRDLLKKASAKFQIEDCKCFLAQDGTLVEDEEYFKSLPAQTLFVIAGKHDNVKTDFELLFEAIRSRNSALLGAGEIVRKFISENKESLLESLKQLEEKECKETELSLRQEHKEWFSGQDSRFSSKEEVMAKRAQDRVRGYFYKTKDEITKSKIYRENITARMKLNEILGVFQYFLIGCDHFSCLFDRKYPRKHEIVEEDAPDGGIPKKRMRMIKELFEEEEFFKDLCVSLCNSHGDFRCQGLWSETTCKYSNHLINPYSSRENFILFQVWNLDHQIELSRSVIPSLLKTVEQMSEENNLQCQVHRCRATNIDIIAYFLELFTTDNLKLVHIVCHDKGLHSLRSKGRILCAKCHELATLDAIMDKIQETSDEKR
ncbi:DNA fragmentation factor subunit beta [Phlebotomus argentipes]|uniref:DNA fragmentation factor subunit beta n=1 Tax=Phlebotomus argentipes TaxID=94469 RepID=UPI0028935EEB|nr:DNA fragmentation factor subunit beta [Phlebotomus argentipes]